jgi:hypothetical protein
VHALSMSASVLYARERESEKELGVRACFMLARVRHPLHRSERERERESEREIERERGRERERERCRICPE